MTIQFTLISIVAVALAAILLRRYSGRKPLRKVKRKLAKLALREKALENRFYISLRKGHRARGIVRIYSQIDIVLLKSILSSRGIASLMLNQNMNRLRTGVPIKGLNDTIWFVLDRDYAKAKAIILKYKRQRILTIGRIRANTKIRNIAEAAIAGVLVNSNIGLPEILP